MSAKSRKSQLVCLAIYKAKLTGYCLRGQASEHFFYLLLTLIGKFRLTSQHWTLNWLTISEISSLSQSGQRTKLKSMNRAHGNRTSFIFKLLLRKIDGMKWPKLLHLSLIDKEQWMEAHAVAIQKIVLKGRCQENSETTGIWSG